MKVHAVDPIAMVHEHRFAVKEKVSGEDDLPPAYGVYLFAKSGLYVHSGMLVAGMAIEDALHTEQGGYFTVQWLDEGFQDRARGRVGKGLSYEGIFLGDAFLGDSIRLHIFFRQAQLLFRKHAGRYLHDDHMFCVFGTILDGYCIRIDARFRFHVNGNKGGTTCFYAQERLWKHPTIDNDRCGG